MEEDIIKAIKEKVEAEEKRVALIQSKGQYVGYHKDDSDEKVKIIEPFDLDDLSAEQSIKYFAKKDKERDI